MPVVRQAVGRRWAFIEGEARPAQAALDRLLEDAVVLPELLDRGFDLREIDDRLRFLKLRIAHESVSKGLSVASCRQASGSGRSDDLVAVGVRTASEPSASIAVIDVEFAIADAASVPIIDTLEVRTRMKRVFPKPLEGEAGLPLNVDTPQFPGFSKTVRCQSRHNATTSVCSWNTTSSPSFVPLQSVLICGGLCATSTFELRDTRATRPFELSLCGTTCHGGSAPPYSAKWDR